MTNTKPHRNLSFLTIFFCLLSVIFFSMNIFTSLESFNERKIIRNPQIIINKKTHRTSTTINLFIIFQNKNTKIHTRPYVFMVYQQLTTDSNEWRPPACCRCSHFCLHAQRRQQPVHIAQRRKAAASVTSHSASRQRFSHIATHSNQRLHL